MTAPTGDASLRAYARLAGAAYVLVIVIGVLCGTFIDSRLIVPGDHAATARNILADETLFRVGIVGAVLMYAGVLVLSAALYVVFERVNRNLALLAMLLRSGEAIVGAATVLFGLAALLLVAGEGRAADGEQWQALVGVFLDVRAAGLDLVLILLGLGGTVFAYLFLVSRYIPRALAAWGMFTYCSILVLAFVSILVPDHPVILETVLYSLGGAFELALGFRLAWKGVDRP